MNLDVMKTFCDLVDTGSFSKAAEGNYVSQSAVSQQLAKLEKEFSAQLIARGGGVVAPTEAGKVFYRAAKDMLRRQEQMVGELRSAANSVRGVLRVGTIYSVGFYLLDPYVRKFISKHPDVHLHVEYTNWNRIYTDVINEDMDLGVVACGERRRSIELVPLASEELVAVFPPGHRLSLRRSVKPAELAGEKYVAFAEGIPTRRHMDRMLKRNKVPVEIVMEFDNIELLKRAIMVGSGVSILPREAVDREAGYKDLAIAALQGDGKWTRPVGVVRRRGKEPSPAERMFLGLLRTSP
jgi:DNA-binding transcriptional LysR family regulator